MFTHVKSVVNRVTNAFGVHRNNGDCTQENIDSGLGRLHSPLTYHRPLFLSLSKEEEKKILDHKTRTAVSPKNPSCLPFNAGYCEVVNAGKTDLNEDCAVALTVVLQSTQQQQYTGNSYSNPPIKKRLKSSTSSCDSCDVEKKLLPTNDCDRGKSEGTANDLSTVDCSEPIGDVKSPVEGVVGGNNNNCDGETSVDMSDDKANIEGRIPENNNPKIELTIPDKMLNSDDVMVSDECSNEAEIVTNHSMNTNELNHNSYTTTNSCKFSRNKPLRLDYFALFDGHAGEGAALYASGVLHEILIERLREIQHLLVDNIYITQFIPACLSDNPLSPDCDPTTLHPDNLITGLLQEIMSLTDEHMKADQTKYKINGGCTALLIVFIFGKMYVAGAGDCRAVISRSVQMPATLSDEGEYADETQTKLFTMSMSQDFTPLTERRRLQYLAFVKPSLLGRHFTRLEFIRRLTNADVGKKVLHRDYHMTGWTYKQVTEDDLRHPMIYGSGKSRRLLATIGVTRGLGDHNLIALNQFQDARIKPFLSTVPEVRSFDLSSKKHSENDVLIVGSDGLWDVLTNDTAAKVVNSALLKFDKNDPNRYSAAAKELAETARGALTDGYWKMTNGKSASLDDITVFVVPLLTASNVHLPEL